MKQNEQELMFRAYQRSILRSYQALKEAVELENFEQAEEILNQLIADTEAEL